MIRAVVDALGEQVGWSIGLPPAEVYADSIEGELSIVLEPATRAISARIHDS